MKTEKEIINNFNEWLDANHTSFKIPDMILQDYLKYHTAGDVCVSCDKRKATHTLCIECINKMIMESKKVETTENPALNDVIGRSEQLICPDCKKPEKEYKDGLCEMCYKWHTS